MNLRILLVTQYFWPENFRINDLVQGLVKLGHHVTVLTGKPNYPSGKIFDGYSLLGRRRETFAGAEVIRVPLVPRGNGGPVRLVFNFFSSPCWPACLVLCTVAVPSMSYLSTSLLLSPWGCRVWS